MKRYCENCQKEATDACIRLHHQAVTLKHSDGCPTLTEQDEEDACACGLLGQDRKQRGVII